jgi:hypothetical protein
MEKNRVGRPSSGIPRKKITLMVRAPDYWEIYDRAISSGKSLSHYIMDSLLKDWRFYKEWKGAPPTLQEARVTELEKAIMTNSIANLREVLSEYNGTSDTIFSSGRVSCIYKDKNDYR